MRLLLNAGANPDKADRKGCTPLILAGDRGHKHVIKLLANTELSQKPKPSKNVGDDDDKFVITV